MRVTQPRPSISTVSQRPATEPARRPAPQVQGDGFEPSRTGATTNAPQTPAATGVDAITLDRTSWLREGGSGTGVEDLQRRLAAEGFNVTVDGRFGPQTEAAVKAYQQAKGLMVDGIVGPQTRAALLGLPPVPPGGVERPETPSTSANDDAPETTTDSNTVGGDAQVTPSGDTATARELEALALQKHGPQFVQQVRDMAGRLGIRPEWILAVMKNESNLNPAARNPNGGASGLIQFMPDTARGLGTTTAALRGMSATQQLAYVERYFAPFKGRIHSGADLYMATFWPAGVGKPDSYRIGGATVARANPIFDLNRNGQITAGEFRDYYRRRYPELS